MNSQLKSICRVIPNKRPIRKPPRAAMVFLLLSERRGGAPGARPRPRGGARPGAPPPPRCYGAAMLWRRKSCAFSAAMTVLSDMSSAPTAGERTIPNGASTPAATGSATML
jgi:hypothetical protein